MEVEEEEVDKTKELIGNKLKDLFLLLFHHKIQNKH